MSERPRWSDDPLGYTNAMVQEGQVATWVGADLKRELQAAAVQRGCSLSALARELITTAWVHAESAAEPDGGEASYV